MCQRSLAGTAPGSPCVRWRARNSVNLRIRLVITCTRLFPRSHTPRLVISPICSPAAGAMTAGPARLTGLSSRAGRCVALLGVALLVALPARAGPEWTGEWDTRWKGGGATLTLRREGDRVTGRYPLYNGQVDGVVRGTKLT